jgi:hypothetical protein
MTPLTADIANRFVDLKFFTPMEIIMRAYDIFLDDTEGRVGQVLETSAKNLEFRDLPNPIDDMQIQMWSDIKRRVAALRNV